MKRSRKLQMFTTRPAERITDDAIHAITATAGRTAHAGRLAALDAMDSLRSSSRQLRHALLDTRDGALRYARHEPAKTVMIAAAAGLVVLGLVALLSQRRHRD
jgi:ElaB/YqjD/DUF883 family membrane-anchored ribosome-binding protein